MAQPPVPPASKLRVEIVLTLVVKFLFLYLLWFWFFQEPANPPPPTEALENQLFGTPAIDQQVINRTTPQEPLNGIGNRR
jgi:hypothetical protein